MKKFKINNLKIEFDGFDLAFELFPILLVSFVFIIGVYSFISCIDINLVDEELKQEKVCHDYYLKTNKILNSCEKYYED